MGRCPSSSASGCLTSPRVCSSRRPRRRSGSLSPRHRIASPAPSRAPPTRPSSVLLLPALALTVTREELARLARDPDVEGIQEDAIYYPTLADSSGIVGAVAASAGGFTGTGQAVAILDTGVDKTHTFLAGKVVSEACYSTTNSTQGSLSTCPGGVSSSTAPGSGVPCGHATCFHGTHVAGIAAGNGTGIRGVAQGASIISVQVFSVFSGGVGAFYSDIDLGLQRVFALRTTFNIASVNMSLGGGQGFSNCDASLPTTKSGD